MTAEEIRDYCLAKAGATESFPFDSETLVFKVGGKMFLLVPLEKQPSQFAAKAVRNGPLNSESSFHRLRELIT